MSGHDYKLSDRYTESVGRAFVSGIQALARVPIEQLRADRTKGLNTAAFVSGYPGSPLGGFDQEVARAAAIVPDLPIVAKTAVNEELAATAIMGTQLAAEQPDALYDGVVGIWYGKAPGLDRAGDALRHAGFAGTSRHGGAVAVVGDDPTAKSSTVPSSSDATLVDLHMPILYPGDVQEVLTLGRHAIELSRITGRWTGLKLVTSVADATGTIDLDHRLEPVIPDLTRPDDPDAGDYVHHPDAILLSAHAVELEREFRQVQTVLTRRYAMANHLNHITVDPGDAWIGLISSGYTYHELVEALGRLGLDSPEKIASAGIRLMHMQMPVPFEPDNIRRFGKGLEEILVVEEKNPTLEWLVKDALYEQAERPRVVGKTHEDGRPLMREYGIIDAGAIVTGLRERLEPRLGERLAPLPPPARERELIPLAVERTPYFCSGCPHNRSTKVPEGSLVGAGIGCHTMTVLMNEDRVGDIAGLTQMGGEGAQWIGMSPFIERDHLFQNIGDGTFFHSGQLAVQAAIDAGVNITYKLLYNGTVAMTGGQDAPGGVEVPEIVTILLAHGVRDILITTDDVDAYEHVDLPTGPLGPIEVWDRDRVIEAQERLRDIEGVTVLIHDQACAAQLRRFRKRGKLTMPTTRVVINHRICEACGDCGEVSNCLSVQAVDTALGVKTKIDQATCNYDMSCLEGDCPSFMTVEVDPATARPTPLPSGELPRPSISVPTDDLAVRIAGIGGTGVVTTAQILGTAAMLDGFDSRGLDQIGLSQKAGPVVSDLRFTKGGPASSNLIGEGGADVVLAFDLLVAASDACLESTSDDTIFIASTSVTPTGSMVGHPELEYPEASVLRDRVIGSRAAAADLFVDSSAVVSELFGDTATANTFLLGAGVQAGVVPVSPESLARAIELNGVAVDRNLAAFHWGRQWAHDPSGVPVTPRQPDEIEMHVSALSPKLAQIVSAATTDEELASLLTTLAGDLVDYQNEKYAVRFLGLVERAVAAEQRVSPGSTALGEAVGRGFHKLLAYKDEYEVARLLIGPEARAAAEAVGGPAAEVTWRLHPPMLRAMGRDEKMEISAKVGGPAMKALARAKRVRGTRFDPFGRAKVRQVERALIEEYESALTTLLGRLDDSNFDATVEAAALPMDFVATRT